MEVTHRTGIPVFKTGTGYADVVLRDVALEVVDTICGNCCDMFQSFLVDVTFVKINFVKELRNYCK